MTIYRDNWRRYLELGLIPYPADRKKKHPIPPWDRSLPPPCSDDFASWEEKYPHANIWVYLGSGFAVIDPDGEPAEEAVQGLALPPGPTSISGGKSVHRWFKVSSPLAPLKVPLGQNGCFLELRTGAQGVLAPPSIHPKSGKAYRWLEGHSPWEIPFPEFPQHLYETIRALGQPGDALSNTNMHSLNIEACHGLVTMFTEGRRDDDLFHVANCLVRGGMPEKEAMQVLEILARSCTPPFPADEVRIKVESALKRSERKGANLTQAVRDFVSVTNGHFSVADCLESVQAVAGVTNRDTVRKILHRLYQEGLVEKYGEKDGVYRRIEQECEPIDFINAAVECLDLRWPFQIEKYVRIHPKNIIVVAGEPNAGKTAYLLNVARLNMDRYKVCYFSSEMGGPELKGRLSKFEGLSLEEWTRGFFPFERSCNFADVIRPDNLNIIDFLEMSDEFYKIGGLIREVHDKLRKGIALIAIQKNPGKDYGLGGVRSLEKARLYLAIEPGKIKIVKAKNWAGIINPNGLEAEFKLAQGCRFVMTSEWERKA